MKKLLLVTMLSFPLIGHAEFWKAQSTENHKIFKEYPFDMYKSDFMRKFPMFGRCQFDSDVKICAPEAYEKLYDIPFNIVIMLDKDRTNSVKLRPSEYSISRSEFWGLFRGLVKSGFVLYQIKDGKDLANIFQDMFDSAEKGKKINRVSDKLDILESKQSTEQTLFYLEKSKLDSILLKGKSRFSSKEEIMEKLPADTRFIEMNVRSSEGQMYWIELNISIPKLKVSTIDDRPAEKF
ncbi:hypothetical protein HPC38_01085 [Pasteurellaceae bacterium HPA106]|uniref:hypothetical protein n=1 Tax=Spirabiliibacterium pneumoniae TaxID=221400 RepID=UPI001AAD1DD3|nr:hypothetical protein [Spirabiliibacterium pneumoniae]MBE2895475.1 hypothetical protein [Spirabiliibacterium pneumoniae]